jgi:hypothetical protein
MAQGVLSHAAPVSSRHSTPDKLVLRVCVVGFCWSRISTALAMKKAIAEAEKHTSHSEPLAALVAAVKAAHEQAIAALERG